MFDPKIRMGSVLHGSNTIGGTDPREFTFKKKIENKLK
jgi:hypothetical protein